MNCGYIFKVPKRIIHDIITKHVITNDFILLISSFAICVELALYANIIPTIFNMTGIIIAYMTGFENTFGVINKTTNENKYMNMREIYTYISLFLS